MSMFLILISGFLGQNITFFAPSDSAFNETGRNLTDIFSNTTLIEGICPALSTILYNRCSKRAVLGNKIYT